MSRCADCGGALELFDPAPAAIPPALDRPALPASTELVCVRIDNPWFLDDLARRSRQQASPRASTPIRPDAADPGACPACGVALALDAAESASCGLAFPES